ncbi:DUF1290 domain-containing protein [bacterium]|nr:DUF1290 domain-containing protein [bacterium]
MIFVLILAIVITAIGFILGTLLTINIPTVYYSFISVVLLALTDSLLFGLHQLREKKPDAWKIIFRLILELFFGCFIIFFGDQGGLDLYLVAAIPLGVSIMFNIHVLIMNNNSRKKI